MTEGEVEPFAPPLAGDEAHSAWFLVVVAWTLSGAALGTALGTSLHLFGVLGGWMVPIGMGSALVAGAAGAVAYWFERAWSAGRPPVVGAHGTLTHPLHAVLFGIPIAIALPSLLWLVVVGSVSAGNIAPGVAFGMTAVALVWAARKLLSSHQLTLALEELERDDTLASEGRLRSLARARWATRAIRDAAALNLGLMSMAVGDLDEAMVWYERVHSGSRAFPHAAAGMGLVAVLHGDFAGAEQHLQQALGHGGRMIHQEVDEIRLLLVYRRDGPEAARELGEQLLGPGAGPLLRAVLSAARRDGGDYSGASELQDEGVDQLVERIGRFVPGIAP